MTKNKIAFAGFMGAILMSVGAANAATTTVATKGYVDDKITNVTTTINNLDNKYVTMQQVADAIGSELADGKIDLSAYQLTDNMVTTTLSQVAEADQGKKYPSVGAVLAEIDTKIAALGLEPEQITALQELIGSNGVLKKINDLTDDVTGLKDDVATLNGEGEGSIAKSIADAITAHTEVADAKYQEQSTADLQIGTTGGKFRNMTDGEKAALASGITAAKVADYDATKTTVDELTADNGTIAELQTAIDGLNGEDGKVTVLEKIVGNDTEGLVADVAANTAAIADNAANILKKITNPEAPCTGPDSTCVLMIQGSDISWTPVTDPVQDPVESENQGA